MPLVVVVQFWQLQFGSTAKLPNEKPTCQTCTTGPLYYVDLRYHYAEPANFARIQLRVDLLAHSTVILGLIYPRRACAARVM